MNTDAKWERKTKQQQHCCCSRRHWERGATKSAINCFCLIACLVFYFSFFSFLLCLDGADGCRCLPPPTLYESNNNDRTEAAVLFYCDVTATQIHIYMDHTHTRTSMLDSVEICTKGIRRKWKVFILPSNKKEHGNGERKQQQNR